MARINLLPWREQRREELKKLFFAMLAGSVLCSAMIMIFVHIMFAGRIDSQLERNAILKSEIAVLDGKIKEIKALKKTKEALISRMAIIQELQGNRTQTVHVFDDFVKVLPKGVHLREITRNNNLITLQGIADSNTNISALMRNITNSLWLSQPVLSEIKTEDDNGKRKSEFRLNSSLSRPEQ